MWKQELASRRGVSPHLEEKQWEEVQKKTFQGWINMHLEKRGMRVQNLDKDLADGVKLINLLEILHGGKIEGRYYKNPKSRPYKIDNVNFALSFITDNLEVKLFGCSAEDVVDGNLKIILGMLWRLIQHYQLTDKNSRQVILDWCKKITVGYTDIKVENFHDSFADGLVFCAMLNLADPTALDYNAIDKSDRLGNLRTAFETAEQKLSIPQLLDPADVVAKHVDERSVLTYVSMWYERFKTVTVAPQSGEAKTAIASSTTTTTTSSSGPKFSTPPTSPKSPLSSSSSSSAELEEYKAENTRLRQELEDARDALAVAKQAQLRADNLATEAAQRASLAEEEARKAHDTVSSVTAQVAEAEAAARAAITARAQAEANAAAAVVAAHTTAATPGTPAEGGASTTAEIELAIANASVKLAETEAALAGAEAALSNAHKEEQEAKATLETARTQLQELNAESDAARERLSDLELKVTQAEEKLEGLFTKITDAKQKLQEITDGQTAAIATFEAKRATLQTEIAALEAQASGQPVAERAVDPAAAAAPAKTRTDDEDMGADTLQEKIMAEQQLEDLQERLKEAEEALASTSGKLEAKKQELADLDTKAGSGDEASTRAPNQTGEVTQALEDAKEELTVLKKKYERAQAKALKSQKKKYTTRIKNRDKELKTLREQTEIDLKAKDDEIERLKTQLAKAQKALGEASTSDATEVNADVELLKQEYSQILAIAKLLEEEESNTRTQRRARNSESEDEDGERDPDE